MRPVSNSRWTPVLALVIWLGACGPGDAQAPAAAPAAAPAVAPALDPADEAALAGAVVAGERERLTALELPLDVSRARVAVHALTGLLAEPPHEAGLVRFRAGVDGLHAAAGGSERAALTRMRHFWRGWTAEHEAAEAPLAARVSALRAALAAFPGPPGAPAQTLDEPLEGAPGSPFFAALPFERALEQARTAGAETAGQAVRGALVESRKRFESVGWPGGFADLCSLWGAALSEAPWRDSSLRVALDDGAVWGYSVDGGDKVALAGVYLRKAREQRAGGPGDLARRITTAARAAERAVEILRAAGAAGEPLTEALLIAARSRLDLGAFERAADRAGEAGRVAREADLDPAWDLEAAVLEATGRMRSGATDAAHTVAVEAARRFDENGGGGEGHEDVLRAELDELAAMALAESGLFADAAERLEAAAVRHLASGRRADAHRARLRAFRFRAQGGDTAAVDDLVAFARETELSPLDAAEAASILLDHGRADEAEEQVERMRRGRSPKFTLIAARIAAARGDTVRARTLFGDAARELEEMTGGTGGRLGSPAAEILTCSSRFEEDHGAPVLAAWLAHRATFHLEGLGVPGELDRAYARLIRLERARMEFGRALGASDARDGLGLPPSRPGAADAALDALLVRLEVAIATRPDAAAHEALAAVAGERFVDPAAQRLATALARAVLGLEREGAGTLPESPGGRWDLVRAVVDLAAPHSARQRANRAFAIAEKAGAREPELRRFACLLALRTLDPGEQRIAGPWERRAEGLAVEPDDLLRLLDLRRSAGSVPSTAVRETLAEGGVFRTIEPLGAYTVALTVTREGYAWERIDPDGALAALRTVVDGLKQPGPGSARDWDALAKAAAEARRAALAGIDTHPSNVVLSIGKPLGHLPLALGAEDAAAGPAWVAGSAFERAESAGSTAPRPLPVLPFYDSPLRMDGTPVRHALVQIAPAPQDAREGLAAAVRKAIEGGADVGTAFTRTVTELRAAWEPPAGVPTAIPAWAAFALRGAP